MLSRQKKRKLPEMEEDAGKEGIHSSGLGETVEKLSNFHLYFGSAKLSP